MSLTDALEAYIAVILSVEFVYDYWYNTRENRIKRRKANAKKENKNLVSPPIPSSCDKKNVAVEPGTPSSLKEGPNSPELVEMCCVCERVHENPIHFQEWAKTNPDGWGCGPYNTHR